MPDSRSKDWHLPIEIIGRQLIASGQALKEKNEELRRLGAELAAGQGKN